MKVFNTFILMAIAFACAVSASDDIVPQQKTSKELVKKDVVVTEVGNSASGSDLFSASGSEGSASHSGSGSEESLSGSDSSISSSSTSASNSESDEMDSMSPVMEEDLKVKKVVKGTISKHKVKALPLQSSPHPTTTMKSSPHPTTTMKSSPHPTTTMKSSPHPTTTMKGTPLPIITSGEHTTPIEPKPVAHMPPVDGSAEEEGDSESSSFSGEDSNSGSSDSNSESDSGSDLFDEFGFASDSSLGSTSDSMGDEITFPVDPLNIDVKTDIKNEGADALTMAVAVGCIVGFIAIIVVAIIAVKKNGMYSSSILGAMATETHASSTDKAIDGSDEEASTDDALERGEGAPLTSRSVTNGETDETEGKFE